jgi:8-oxo-dGTP pyrophosphatase MutT (NUDIX family)
MAFGVVMELGNLTGCGALVHAKTTGRYLWLQRANSSYSGTWGIVGGKAESGESPTRALAREYQEELGLEFDPIRLVPIEQYTATDRRFVYYTFYILVEQEFIPELNDEHSGYCWTNLESRPTPLHPGVWRIFEYGVVREKLQQLEIQLPRTK